MKNPFRKYTVKLEDIRHLERPSCNYIGHLYYKGEDTGIRQDIFLPINKSNIAFYRDKMVERHKKKTDKYLDSILIKDVEETSVDPIMMLAKGSPTMFPTPEQPEAKPESLAYLEYVDKIRYKATLPGVVKKGGILMSYKDPDGYDYQIESF